jgi:hypothetical protein
MKWVTRSHIHIDRVACPWLISRFVDSNAEFIFAAKNQVNLVAQEQNAIPFDIPDVELGHRNGKCSFESIIEKYELKDPGLQRLAKIVHSADIEDEIDSDPIARGLDAIATGYGLLYPDDQKNLSKQFEVYDALYAWCRLEVTKK